MEDNTFTIGLEIECLLNENLALINRDNLGGYHSGKPIGTYWKVEQDGSLRNQGEFSNGFTAEFVSNPIKTHSDYKNAIKEFYEIIGYDKDEKKELKEYVRFNSSCGCHYHISFNGFNFNKRALLGGLQRTRKYHFDLIKKSNVTETTKNCILQHYFRHYSRKTTKKRFFDREDRYEEYNFHSENEGKGFELRSFNLLNVETFEEFEEMIEIFYKTLEYLRGTMNSAELGRFSIPIPKEESHTRIKNEEIEFYVNEKENERSEEIECVI